MIKIINKIDSEKYELVPRIGGVREPCRPKTPHYAISLGERIELVD